MSSIATHDGTVISIQPGIVNVQMHVVSACASCKAHEKCAFVDKADKTVEVETDDWQQYAPGDSVIVSVNEGLGLLAVLLAYILPAVLILASVIILSLYTSSEALAAIAPIILITVYFLFLYRYRSRLQRKFTFGLIQK